MPASGVPAACDGSCRACGHPGAVAGWRVDRGAGRAPVRPRTSGRSSRARSPTSARRRAAAGRDAVGAHLPARPARRRRRRRHERLHRRGRQAAGRRAASRSRSSPAPPPATCRRSSSWPRACTCGTSPPARSRAWPRRTCPAQLCAFTAGVLRAEAQHEPGCYDVVHSHYWLSGQVGWLARERWGVPLVHSAHTLAKVKNAALAEGDAPEPRARVIGEEQVVAEADRLIANTAEEAAQLVDLYGADPRAVRTVVTRRRPRRASRPATGAAARDAGSGCAADARRAAVRRPHPAAQGARRRCCAPPPQLLARRPGAARPARRCVVVGGPSGSGLAAPAAAARARRRPRHRRRRPVRAAAAARAGSPTTTAPPTSPSCRSYNESFGLVALEAQACGTPVVAAARRRAAHGGRATASPACSSTATTRATGPRALARAARARRARSPARRRRACGTPRAFSLGPHRRHGAARRLRARRWPHRPPTLGRRRPVRSRDERGRARTSTPATLERRCRARARVRAPDAGRVRWSTLPGDAASSRRLLADRRRRTRCWSRRSSAASPTRTTSSSTRYLLQRNARMYGVACAIDGVGDVYLAGRLPLPPSPPTRSTGCSAASSSTPTAFNTLLELGFGSSIRREWAWRVKRGESLRQPRPCRSQPTSRSAR